MQESFATSQVQETILFCHVDLIVLGFSNESTSVVSVWLGWLMEFFIRQFPMGKNILYLFADLSLLTSCNLCVWHLLLLQMLSQRERHQKH